MFRPSSQLTINTAIVYMHRFYMHHSFTKFSRNVSTVNHWILFFWSQSIMQGKKLGIDFTVGFAELTVKQNHLINVFAAHNTKVLFFFFFFKVYHELNYKRREHVRLCATFQDDNKINRKHFFPEPWELLYLCVSLHCIVTICVIVYFV